MEPSPLLVDSATVTEKQAVIVTSRVSLEPKGAAVLSVEVERRKSIYSISPEDTDQNILTNITTRRRLLEVCHLEIYISE